MTTLMTPKTLASSLVMAASLLTQGCATVEGSAAWYNNPYRIVPLYEQGAPERKFQPLAPVEVTLKKNTVFDREPTKENVNLLLQSRARELNADAVIGITYETLKDEQDWNYMVGKGTAIKFTR